MTENKPAATALKCQVLATNKNLQDTIMVIQYILSKYTWLKWILNN